MKVSKAHYEESIEYLKKIANNNFFYELKDIIEGLSKEYKALEQEKKEGISVKNELREIKDKMNFTLRPYKKDFFRNHVNRVIAYKKDINIEDAAKAFMIDNDDCDDLDYKLIGNATIKINEILINPTILAILYGCSRQTINTLLLQRKLFSPVIGHVAAFKLTDVIK